MNGFINSKAGIPDPTEAEVVDAIAAGGAPVKATGAEINTGTNDTKFATPKAINDSNLVTRPIVATSDAIITPSASNTGTEYRLENPVTQQINLPPSAGCVVGKTVFYFQLAASTANLAANGIDTLEGLSHSEGIFTAIEASSTMDNFYQGSVLEVRLVKANVWSVAGGFCQV